MHDTDGVSHCRPPASRAISGENRIESGAQRSPRDTPSRGGVPDHRMLWPFAELVKQRPAHTTVAAHAIRAKFLTHFSLNRVRPTQLESRPDTWDLIRVRCHYRQG